MADDSAGRLSGSAFSLTTSRGWVSAQSTARSPSSSSSSSMARPLSGGSSMYWSYSAISNSCSSSPMSSGPGPVLSSLVMRTSLPQRQTGHAGGLRELAGTGDEGLLQHRRLDGQDGSAPAATRALDPVAAGLPVGGGEELVAGRAEDDLLVHALRVLGQHERRPGLPADVLDAGLGDDGGAVGQRVVQLGRQPGRQHVAGEHVPDIAELRRRLVGGGGVRIRVLQVREIGVEGGRVGRQRSGLLVTDVRAG